MLSCLSLLLLVTGIRPVAGTCSSCVCVVHGYSSVGHHVTVLPVSVLPIAFVVTALSSHEYWQYNPWDQGTPPGGRHDHGCSSMQVS